MRGERDERREGGEERGMRGERDERRERGEERGMRGQRDERREKCGTHGEAAETVERSILCLDVLLCVPHQLGTDGERPVLRTQEQRGGHSDPALYHTGQEMLLHCGHG